VCKVHSLHARICVAVVQQKLPALVICRILVANNTLPAVEVHGAAESRQANIEFKLQSMESHKALRNGKRSITLALHDCYCRFGGEGLRVLVLDYGVTDVGTRIQISV